MISPDRCLTAELGAVLRRARRSYDQSVNNLAKLRRFVKVLNQENELKPLQLIGISGDIVELAGTVFAVKEKASLGNVLQAIGQMTSLVARLQLDAVREGNMQADQAEQLRILQEDLRLAIDQFVDDRDKAQDAFEAFWSCTDRYRPRQVELFLDVRGVIANSMATGEIHRNYLGRANLRPARDASTATYFERFSLWLDDPDLTETFFAANGTIELTVPEYSMTSLRPEVTFEYGKPRISGGPLKFKTGVRWLRAKPTTAMLGGGVKLSGSQTLTIEGTVTINSSTHPWGGPENVLQILTGQLGVHLRPAATYLDLDWNEQASSYLFVHREPEQKPTTFIEVRVTP